MAHGLEAGSPGRVLGIVGGHRLPPGGVRGPSVVLPRPDKTQLKGCPGGHLLRPRLVQLEDVLQPLASRLQLTLVLRKASGGACEWPVG